MNSNTVLTVSFPTVWRLTLRPTPVSNSVDYALPKRYEHVPALLSGAVPLKRMRYGHFGCNVIHESLAFARGVDVQAEKAAIKKQLEAVGGVLPAEHGHGTEYPAPAQSQRRWMDMDPTNTMNPGVGGLSYKRRYGA
jgi:D-lactate dehydrogenase